MQPVYTIQQLERLKRPQLWEICQQLSLPKYPASAKCVEAILEKQPFKVEEAAPQKITTAQIDDTTTVVYANDIPLATISHNDTDNYLTHPWVVMVNGNEIHATSTWQRAYSYITWHHKQNTLLDKPFDELTHTEWLELKTDTPAPDQDEIVAVDLYRAINEQLAHNVAQEQPNTCTTHGTQPAPEIQVLERHGDEYITHNPQNGNYYVVRPNHPEKHHRCECGHTYYRGAKCKHQQAVEKHLSLSQPSSLLDKPFDKLTQHECEGLKAREQEIEETLEQTEVDSIPDQNFGIICRLWHGTTLLGTFYRKIFTDEWIATPADSIHPYHCPSEDDACYWLVAHLKAATKDTEFYEHEICEDSIQTRIATTEKVTVAAVKTKIPPIKNHRGSGRKE